MRRSALAVGCVLLMAACDQAKPGFLEPPGFDAKNGLPTAGLTGGSARADVERATGGELQNEISVFSTAGKVASPRFRGRLMVGPIQPVADGQSADHNLTLIPGAILERR